MDKPQYPWTPTLGLERTALHTSRRRTSSSQQTSMKRGVSVREVCAVQSFPGHLLITKHYRTFPSSIHHRDSAWSSSSRIFRPLPVSCLYAPSSPFLQRPQRNIMSTGKWQGKTGGTASYVSNNYILRDFCTCHILQVNNLSHAVAMSRRQNSLLPVCGILK